MCARGFLWQDRTAEVHRTHNRRSGVQIPLLLLGNGIGLIPVLPVSKEIHTMLYNITFRTYDESLHLIPQVPYTAAPDEDRVTKRICFADSVEHCIAAIGPSERDLYTGCHIIVRSVDETLLDQSKIVTPKELFDTGRVPDALENQEYWYLDDVDVVRELYRVDSFIIERKISFSCIRREDMADIIKKYRPESPMKRTDTVEWAYARTLDGLYKQGLYNEADAFEEEVVSLPWSQGLNVTGLRMKKITGGD